MTSSSPSYPPTYPLTHPLTLLHTSSHLSFNAPSHSSSNTFSSYHPFSPSHTGKGNDPAVGDVTCDITHETLQPSFMPVKGPKSDDDDDDKKDTTSKPSFKRSNQLTNLHHLVLAKLSLLSKKFLVLPSVPAVGRPIWRKPYFLSLPRLWISNTAR